MKFKIYCWQNMLITFCNQLTLNLRFLGQKGYWFSIPACMKLQLSLRHSGNLMCPWWWQVLTMSDPCLCCFCSKLFFPFIFSYVTSFISVNPMQILYPFKALLYLQTENKICQRTACFLKTEQKFTPRRIDILTK